MKEKIEKALENKIDNILKKDDITCEEYRILIERLEYLKCVENETERKKELFEIFFKTL